MKWRCSAQAGGVEGSKFCLVSVALPARCVSSISPRFHFRRHAFCFLLLAAILESSKVAILKHSDKNKGKMKRSKWNIQDLCNTIKRSNQ
jgi:hypothetical protein